MKSQATHAEFGKLGKVLVTGHTGFKGTWLTLLLESLGIEVVGISLPAEPNSMYSMLNRLGSADEYFLDIRNYDDLNKAIRKIAPDTIIHLAAQPLVLTSYQFPRATFETNAIGTVNLLDSAFNTQTVETIIIATTDKVYKNENLQKRFTESEPLEGKDPYSASKVATEAAVKAWQQIAKISGGPNVISVRAGNVIGGGDSAKDRLLPDLARGFMARETVQIRHGGSTRPWQHVLDPLGGYLLAAAQSRTKTLSDAFNFAPDGASLTVSQVATIASKTWRDEPIIEELNEESRMESISLELDASKSKSELNWLPTLTQAESVESTIQWWQKVHAQSASPLEASQNDLMIFLNNAKYVEK